MHSIVFALQVLQSLKRLPALKEASSNRKLFLYLRVLPGWLPLLSALSLLALLASEPSLLASLSA